MDHKLIQRAAHDILHSKKTIAFTGAGISVESGIPAFRGSQGLWEKYDPEEYAHIVSFRSDPDRVWLMLKEMFSLIIDAKPNPGHTGLAELERMGLLSSIITQNVDGLHQRAGSAGVLDYHGNVSLLRCSSCGARYDPEGFDLERMLREDRLPPMCEACNGVLKSDIVHFHEAIPIDVAEQSQEEAERCDCMLICGTSAVVYPFANLPRIAKQRYRAKGTLIIEINAEPTPLTAEGISDYIIQGKTGTILPKLLEEVKLRLH